MLGILYSYERLNIILKHLFSKGMCLASGKQVDRFIYIFVIVNKVYIYNK